MKKAVAIVLSLVLCISLAASVFAAPVSGGSETFVIDYPDVAPNDEVIVQELTNGNIVVTIPEAAAKTKAAIEIPTEVKAADEPADAAVIAISAPKTSSGIKVAIPVTNPTNNTVAVIVNPDGSENIIKTSTVGENGIVFNVEGNANIKIIDNTKEFTDVSGWEDPGVAFATSHELFVGDENGAFRPKDAMNKAMIVTILSRIEDDTMTTTGAHWYDESLAWATSAGLTDSSNPTGIVSRAEMILMLYRYAGSPATAYDLSAFTDAGELSGEYLAAMKWAVANGIVLGVGNNMLAPTGTTTRATFATLLMRYCAVVA